ncbi:MAG TPA: glycosyltransferase family 2 protein [Bryobacteraceae bacterium]|nr:glycosyltransferase family 2 protein [Bryobacteraceae bacterium]
MRHRKLMVIVPALNEEAAIGDVVRSVRKVLPGTPVLVIDDHSSDGTARAARDAGADVVRLDSHSGLGICLRTGYRIALERGCDYVIRVDGDGQHEARDIPAVLNALLATGADAVIGSRFIGAGRWRSPWVRSVGIGLFRRLLTPILGRVVHDPTSGFVGVNRRALRVFANALPLVCPEIGALLMLRRINFLVHEIPCRMHPRRTGRSSFNFAKSIQYALHALSGIAVGAFRQRIPMEQTPRHGFESE